MRAILTLVRNVLLVFFIYLQRCLLYTSDAADEL